MKRLSLWLPLIIVASIFGLFAAGLISPPERKIVSGIIGKQMPEFSLRNYPDAQPFFSGNVTDGKPHLINLFASWCVPCIAEAPVLLQLQDRGVAITGIAIREQPASLAQFLGEHGNPYERIGYDTTTRTQILFGSTGVPESFIVDSKGKIVHQHIGVITPEDVPLLIAKMEDAR